MKIVGYCALWTIALALLVAMCAIIKEGYVGRPGAIDTDIVAGKIASHVAVPQPASKRTLRVSLPAT